MREAVYTELLSFKIQPDIKRRYERIAQRRRGDKNVSEVVRAILEEVADKEDFLVGLFGNAAKDDVGTVM